MLNNCPSVFDIDSGNILQNTMSVTMGVQTSGTIDGSVHASGSMEGKVPDKVIEIKLTNSTGYKYFVFL